MSVKPAVAIRAVGAARPSSSALVATVIPWENSSISSGERSARTSAASTAAITPSDWSPGVVGDLAVTRRPSNASTASVKVPPTSTPKSMGGVIAPRAIPARGLTASLCLRLA